MSLNPIQFGEHVVEQFRRYLLTYFAIARGGAKVRLGEYRTKRLILGYYDAYAAGDLSCWLGPEEVREPRIHERTWRRGPDGLDG